MARRMLAVAATALTAALLPATGALGATAPKGPVVTAGGGVASLAGDANVFFPSTVTIAKGSTVTFAFAGFHNVGVLKTGQKAAPALIVPTGATYAAANDPAGAPYWWGGVVGQLGFNAQVAAPTKTAVVTGKTFVGSGFPTGPKFTWTASFPKVGSYKFFCSVHPGMSGIVHVVATGAQSPAVAARRAKTTLAAQLVKIKKLAKAAAKPGASNEILAGAGDRHIALLKFYPSALTVKTGSTVTFRLRGNTEVHTITFGPKDYVDGVEKAFGAPGPFIPGEAMLPSDPPGPAPVDITGANHGNGFVSSGVINDPGAGPAPHSFQARFTKAGTYEFRCIIHSDTMKGTITVVD